MFNYNHLYYFYVTARLGGVSNASKFLTISQPSLSTQIKTFEASVERSLFEKVGRKMQLTSEGERVYAYCRQIFEIANNLSEYLKSPEQKDKRRIGIGVSEQIERPFVADLLGNILQRGKEHVHATLTVSSGSEKELMQRLRAQEIDLVLTNRSLQSDDLHEVVSLKMPVGFVISKNLLKLHGFKKTPTLAEVFKNDGIVLFVPSEKMRLRHELDVYMQQKNLKKPILMESDILSILTRAVVDDGGCAFLPIPYIYNELKLGLLTVLGPSEGLWRHRISLISRKQLKYDPLFEELKNNLTARK
ncbi:MAG: LysR family transcriptional regulator [Bdellovibrionaceae bacterium]|nr:LysR family transcriptional regulator [Pseudobdellovibrionaceae bacterium]